MSSSQNIDIHLKDKAANSELSGPTTCRSIEAQSAEEHPTWLTLHEKACFDGRDTYIDPLSGYQVFTGLHHMKRGKCCKSGCRHCPYGWQNVR